MSKQGRVGLEAASCGKKAGAELATALRVEELRLFILHFEHRAAVERAFAVVADERAIGSCVVEPEELRIRFLATQKTGKPLLERVYEQGGLTWCRRYQRRSS